MSNNLSEIVASAHKVTDIVSEISDGAGQQATAIEQVSLAMPNMDKVVQQTAANSEQASAAAGRLSEQATGLTELVGRFQLRERSHTVDEHAYEPTLKAVGM